MTMKKWRGSGFGKRGTGSNSSVVDLTTSGDMSEKKVLPDTEWYPSALYVVDLVRFRQMAAGVCQASFSDPLHYEPQIFLVGYPANSLSAAFSRPSLSCQSRPRWVDSPCRKWKLMVAQPIRADLPNNLQGYVPIVSARRPAVIYFSELLRSIPYTKIGYGYVTSLN